MKTDRTTKVLRALIAMALFLNVFVPLLQPPVMNAQTTDTMERILRSIDANVSNIYILMP